MKVGPSHHTCSEVSAPYDLRSTWDVCSYLRLFFRATKRKLTVLNIFTKCSGLNINIDKTQAKYIGSKQTCDYFPHGLSWITTPIQTLGIVITDNKDKNYKFNFQNKIANLTTLNICKQRRLSIKGKITIINSLALVPLIYVSSVISTPQRVINEINNIVQNVIWDWFNLEDS